MAFYELGMATVAAATAAPAATTQGATTVSAMVREIGEVCNAATASSVLIGRPANTPVGTGATVGSATNPDSSPASVVNSHSTWSTAPTVPTVVFRRVTLPAVIGAGIVFVWNAGEELFLSKTAGSNQWLVLWNYGAGTMSVLNQYMKWIE